MKQWFILFTLLGWIFAPSGSLLAQKGKGRMGAPGLGVNLPQVSGKGKAGSEAAAAARSPRPGGPAAAANVDVGSRVAANPALSTVIQPLLPPGATIATAAAGFRNQGQFIAALHVSRNLGIPFDQLKSELTENHPDSLGQAIHQLRPDLSRNTVRSAVRQARRQAEQDIDAAQLESKLSSNAALAAKAQSLLPAGTDLQAAAAGFENIRDFLVAEHLAHDLNIPFAQLKAQVAGTNPVSFKQAIATLRPDLSSASIKAGLKTARQEAKADLEAAGETGPEEREAAEP